MNIKTLQEQVESKIKEIQQLSVAKKDKLVVLENLLEYIDDVLIDLEDDEDSSPAPDDDLDEDTN